ncbi:hypothetical protein AKJ09_07553 [Labilithrix luteola]|uniref:HipA-like C-terminal domain-containing protein n=1 Tax=Labilithrix luteola TaxID=1391654 RepID=A0A0K1Q654_9BACT|nr:hypothetical protein AKJ09_07553 [Labilithrix luteola]
MPDAAPSSTPSPPGSSSAAPEAKSAPEAIRELPAKYAGAARTAKPIGHTSVVFKLELTNGAKAVFKPASRRGPLRYKGEIAAYRLASALGLVNVPPAFARTFDRAELLGALGGETSPGGELLKSEATGSDSKSKGSLVGWIDKLEFLPLEAEPLRSRWHGWLAKGNAIPDEPFDADAGSPLATRDLAAQTSTLVAFDYLTGNWDRWSGANVGFDRGKGLLLFVDNDGAFFENPPKDALARNTRILESVDRFSRGFIEHVRNLDERALAIAIADETPGAPLLSQKVLRTVLERRKELLRVVDAKIAANGEAETLFFP